MFATKTARMACMLFALSAFAGGAQAATYTFDTLTNLGNWSATQANADGNTNYAVGNSAGTLWRNFFTFDLASLNLSNQQIVSATLQLRKWWYTGSDPSETVDFYDVSTLPEVLNFNQGSSAAIYNDLGSGTPYGSVGVPRLGSIGENSTGDTINVSLNSAALANIGAAVGGYFSIGGTCPSCTTGQTVFSGSSATGIQQLVVQTAPIPEPSTYAMLGIGLAALAFLRRRKQV